MDRLPFAFMNAAGWVKTPELVAKVASVPLTTHILAGSFTVQGRAERTGGTVFDVLEDGTSSNNLSLPNKGVPYLRGNGPDMVRIAHDHGKELIVSGAPFTPEDDALLAETAAEIGADGYESNRGCPNTEVSSIISYNFEMMEQCDEAVNKAIGAFPWRQKVSPYANPNDRIAAARLIGKSSSRGGVAINTFANARLRYPDGKLVITAHGTNGYGGLAGTGLYYIALLNAEHFAELLKPAGKDVYGVGGIKSGERLEDFRAVGCTGMQVATALFHTEDPRVLQGIGSEWAIAYG